MLSGFFLIIQIILLLGFIYAINEYLIDKDHASHKVALVGTCEHFEQLLAFLWTLRPQMTSQLFHDKHVVGYSPR